MSDIVRRLRTLQHFDVCYPVPHPTCAEAADRIAQLEAALRLATDALADIGVDDVLIAIDAALGEDRT